MPERRMVFLDLLQCGLDALGDRYARPLGITNRLAPGPQGIRQQERGGQTLARAAQEQGQAL